MKNTIFHCFFEQSGTFKNEFKKLGYKAFDYDILNEFGETNYLIDLYNEIEKGYLELPSIFDKMKKEKDFIIAFFPCIRFEAQILLSFRGDNSGYKNWSLKQKLNNDLKLHQELHQNYSLITKLVLICLNRGIPLIIENPYSSQHYLTRYWALKPSIIDKNRSESGDHFVKPTQYFFVNCKPKYNLLFEAIPSTKLKIVSKESTVNRSMISPKYANRFIREFILENIEGSEVDEK